MQELNMQELDEVSGGRIAGLLVLAQMISDFCEGFADGYEAGQQAK